eukprot:gnl/TRDRNA2_/TRDRNA2_177151_c1_seq4.p1 gnl/TRDRNA2_/TRDRNA2_177151_c1~~gnl/TRDRNA2_/TRDRNA2_177151_c1_seq4.p1  ORF type:complete len:318 (+),score=49.86 gnl/TRDRNA2_/TRDRNA2_177151_c1_seq4:3-956(+)
MPFGDDANDLPLHEMQRDLNMSIRFLLKKEANQAPGFAFDESVHTLLKVKVCGFEQHIGPSHASLPSRHNTHEKAAVEASISMNEQVTPASASSPRVQAAQRSVENAHLMSGSMRAVAQVPPSAAGANPRLAAQTTAVEQSMAAAEAMAAAAAQAAAQRTADWAARGPTRIQCASEGQPQAMSGINATSRIVGSQNHNPYASHAVSWSDGSVQPPTDPLFASEVGLPKKSAVSASVAKKVEAAMAAAKADADARRSPPFGDIEGAGRPLSRSMGSPGSRDFQGLADTKIRRYIQQHGHCVYEWDHADPTVAMNQSQC